VRTGAGANASVGTGRLVRCRRRARSRPSAL